MEINEELIDRFFKKDCTPEEADLVAAFLEANPAIAEAYFSQQELEATSPVQNADEVEWEAWENLQQELHRRRFKKNAWRLAAAACIIGLLMGGYWFSGINNRNDASLLADTNQSIENKIPDGWIEIANATDTLKQVVLKDGSKIRLASGAKLRYNDAAWSIKRDIELEGEATFYVAKDKTRPFTVYCEQVAVRALGTIFSVRQHSGADSLRVRLFEGKVLVRKLQNRQKKDSLDLIQPVTLAPGQELVFAERQNLALIRRFLPNVPHETIAVKKQAAATSVAVAPTGWIEFNDQPLSDLFGSLEVLYNVEINYHRLDVKDVYFIGRFEPYDTIDGILAIIARLNGLTVEKIAAGKYQIKKAG